MQPITRGKAIAWMVATIFVPLCITSCLTSVYIAHWYWKTGYQGALPNDVLMRAMMIMTAPGLWLTVAIWWLIHRRQTSFAELFATRTRSLLCDLLVGLGLGILWIAVYGLSNAVSFGDMFVLNLAKVKSIPTSLSAGFCEEFLFRGFVFLLLARAGGGNKSQLVWSSIAFGMAHCFWGPWGMVWTAVLGFTFGAARLWRGSVWPAVVAHSVLDLCIEPALLEKAFSGGFG